MPFVKDYGTCCIVVPLKFGAGLVCVLAWAHSVVCILALFTGDIRFQPNGYNMYTYKLPSIAGAAGIVLGFVGLLGVYDDKPSMVKLFNYWFFAKLVTMLTAMLADYWTLLKCDSWMTITEHYSSNNPQMEALAQSDVCPWARWAYIVGCIVDLGVWGYFFYRTLDFQRNLELNPTYSIDFGREQYDKQARWRLFQVKDPTSDMVRPKRRGPKEDESENVSNYGSISQAESEEHDIGLDLEEQEPQEPPPRYGPDGQRLEGSGGSLPLNPTRPLYRPDGTRAGESDGGFAPAPRHRSPADMVNL